MFVLTKFALLYLLVLIAVMLGLGVFFYPFESVASIVVFLGAILALNVAASFPAGAIHAVLKRKNSTWLRPVPQGVGGLLVNSVVAIWLCMVGLLVFLMLRHREAYTSSFVLTIFLVVGLGFGWYIRERFTTFVLLPFGMSFLASLFVVIVIIAGFGL